MKFCPACGTEYPSNVSVCKHDKEVLRAKTSDADSLIGQVLKGTYRIDERIAGGGMSTIYRATQLVIERPVAVKVLLPNLQPDPTFVKRFFREAKLLGALSHPNIVTLFDCGQTEQELVFLVTEFLHGKNLDQMVPAKKGLSFIDIQTIMSDICAAVGEAHAQNIIHRDLKPSNIFLLKSAGMRPQIKVLDFGIAKSLENRSQELTQAGAIVGTPGYMAPEQIKIALKADHRADVYALGALLFLMAAGRHAYVAKSSFEKLQIQMREDPTRVDFAALGKPDGLNEVIQTAMARDPDQRFQSVNDLLVALAKCGQPSRRASGVSRTHDDDEDATEIQASYDRAQLLGLDLHGSRHARRHRRLSMLVWLMLALILGATGYLGYVVFLGGESPTRTIIEEVVDLPDP